MIKLLSSLVFAVTAPLLLFGQGAPSARSRPLVFRNVTLIDMRSDRPRANITVVIEGDRITAIGRDRKIPKDAQVIDAGGRFLIPGLWDMHVHIFNNVGAPGTNNKETYFPLFLANGVTGVRDMFTDADDIKLVEQWRRQVGSGKMLAPRIVPGSSIIDGVPVVQANSVGVSNAEEARLAVRTFKAAGAGFIKVYENLSRESYFAIAAEARRTKIPFAGHVPESVTPKEASAAGQRSIEHLTGMSVACSWEEEKYRKAKEITRELILEMVKEFSEAKCGDVAGSFVKNKTWQVPTMVLNRAFLLSDDEGVAGDARLRYITGSEAKGWAEIVTARFKPATRANRELRYRNHVDVLRVMHRSGVPVLAGTDVGNLYVYAGFSLHDELRSFVDAGYTPFEALRTATVNPARYLGEEKSFGTIEVGKLADLVLLDADPLADISNTKKINAVVTNGKYLSRAELDKMLSDAAGRAEAH